jgi:hypothetical protein
VKLELGTWRDMAQAHAHTPKVAMQRKLLELIHRRSIVLGEPVAIVAATDYPAVDATAPEELEYLICAL